LPNRQKRKTQNRHLLKAIITAKADIIGEIALMHIYSHQDSADEERKAKITKQRNAFSEDDQKLYALFVMGNETADVLAKEATDKRTENPRNWEKEPIQHVDDFYLVRRYDERTTLEDRAPHKWIKEDTQKEILTKKHKAKARSKYLEFNDQIDQKRSFASGKRNKHRDHGSYVALFKLRMHCAPTAKKTVRREAALDANNTYKQFFKQLYPDDKCHACAKKGITTIEDTHHMISCQSREDRNVASEKLWREIYDIIRKAQKNNSTYTPESIKPFVLRTQSSLALFQPPAGGVHLLPTALGKLQQFSDDAAALGLIPRAFVSALRELRVESPEKVADEVVRLCQNAVAADLQARHKTIAEDRSQKLLFGRLVLGKA
jgi:hypothetical protein